MSKIILDLCGGTGSWSRPWEAAGYDVRILTLPEYDVTRIRKEYIKDVPYLRLENEITGRYEYISIRDVYGILAAPPCTEFSLLNCKAEARERNPAEGLVVVMACLNVIRWCNPQWWAMENPVGYLREYMGVPQLTFQPWEYGDPWTKRTDIWGEFNKPKKLYKNWEDVPNKLPLYTRPGRGKPNFAYLHKSAWIDIPQLSYHKPVTDAEFRAMTPPGFANAFFEVNNADGRARKMANEKRLIDANKLDSDLLGTLIPDIFAKHKRRFTVGDVRTLLQKAPTVDAVEVIRCRDCKYFSRDEENNRAWCNYYTGCIETAVNGYCYHGKKMDGWNEDE